MKNSGSTARCRSAPPDPAPAWYGGRRRPRDGTWGFAARRAWRRPPGKNSSRCPVSSRTAKKTEGCFACKQRLAGLLEHALARKRAHVHAAAQVRSSPARRASQSARRTGRRGTRAARPPGTCRPPHGAKRPPPDRRSPPQWSMISPVSTSISMALTVKSRRRLASRVESEGSTRDVEIRMPRARARFAARHGDVQVRMFQGEHAKGRALFKHSPQRGEHRAQARGRYAIDLDVDILRLDAHARSRT